MKNSPALFIASAGNSATDLELNPSSFPAAYDLDNTITVTATDPNDGLAYFSNYGNISVDLRAPGEKNLLNGA